MVILPQTALAYCTTAKQFQRWAGSQDELRTFIADRSKTGDIKSYIQRMRVDEWRRMIAHFLMQKRNPAKVTRLPKPRFVVLAHGPNPDIERGGYWSGGAPDAPRTATVPITTFAEASRICRAYIAKLELGGGNWYGGSILDRRLRQFAYVSYNGRVWVGKKGAWSPGQQEIKINPRRTCRRRR